MALREVGQVLVRESDVDALIRQVCRKLTETGAYENAWITVFEAPGQRPRVATSPGLDGAFDPLGDRLLAGDLPHCADRALEAGTTIIIEHPPSECGTCPLAGLYPDRIRLACPIAFADRRYGVVAACVPTQRDDDVAEKRLFSEMAGDVAFALHKIEHLHQVDELHTQYRNLFENSHVPMLLIDPEDGTIVSANPGAVAFYGWDKADLVGNSIHDINVLSRDAVAAEMGAARRGQRQVFRFRHRIADGSIRDVEVSSGTVRSRDKTLLFSIIHDVTDRLREQKELADTKEVLEQAQKIGRFGHFDLDVAADRWTSSSVLNAIFGIDAAYPRTIDGWLDLVDPDDRSSMRTYLVETVLRNRFPFDRTFRIHRRADGQLRWVHGRGHLFVNAQGRAARLLGTIQDVTEIEQTYQRLNGTIRDLRMAQRIARMGNWRYDPAKRQFHIGEDVCRIYGLEGPCTVLPLDAFLRLHAPADRPGLSEAIRMTARKGGGFELTLRLEGDEESCQWIAIIGQADPEQRPEGALVRGVVQDVTAETETREELRRAKENADLANRTKSEFLANVSHEIRTPLNAIIGFAELMSTELYGPHGHDKYAEYSALIESSGKTLLDLVSDIIDLSRVEIGAMEIEEDVLEMAGLFESSVRLFEMRAAGKQITLTTDLNPHRLTIRGDERRLRQIVINLLGNAIKFTPNGGSVVLRGGLDDAGRCVISVTDTGIGISPDQTARILTVFGRARDDYVRAQEGSGLGLPLCQRMAELHGGTLTIDSEPGEGTTVSVVLPPERTIRS
ncbi:ATP-binding protein [uncultured Rhodospira sp.]|uniref:ATP-binding protein n=1 Tax=uncultured Rhodospira sp. TaxID=1936189 RepID=UPI0026105AF5|nr:ATP-binding protein [uncultured Rhodospira sp.]